MNKQEMIVYETDASQIKGKAKEIFVPQTIAQLCAIVKEKEKICIRGGGTGLVGGAVPQNGQDNVIDLTKLNTIGTIDLTRKTIEVEAGVIIQDLQNHIKKYNLEFPITPITKNVCTIGGMVATNATSLRSTKYKNTVEWVRWIEVIDANGNIDRKGKTEISDYAGMEGITGVIAKVCLNLIPLQKRTASLVKVKEPKNIISVVKHLKNDPSVSILEFIDKKISLGIGLEGKYHLIIEYENQSGVLQNEAYEELLQKEQEIYSYLMTEEYTRIEDPKIIIDRFLELLEWCEIRNIPLTANLGTGVIRPAFFKAQEKYIPELMKLIKKHGGKVSESFGIGLLKKEYVEFNDKKIIENIKKRTDPQNKFNNGKVV